MDITEVRDAYEPILKEHFPGAELEVIAESYIKTLLGPWSFWIVFDSQELAKSRGKGGIWAKLCVGPEHYTFGADGIPEELKDAEFGAPLNKKALHGLVALVKTYIREQAQGVLELCGG